MHKDRVKLEEQLGEILNKIKHNRKEIEKIDELMYERNRVPLGTILEITQGRTKLSEIDETLLCIVADTTSQVSGEIRIAPINFFTENEINFARSNEYFTGETNELLPITLDNVLQAKPDEYITVMKITDLVHWENEGLIQYDYETQRSAVYVRKKDGVVPTPDVNKQHVKEISEHQLNGTYIVDTITLNIFSEEITAVTYNARSKTLKINKGAIVSITDGFHRLMASKLTVSQNPNTDEVLQVAIKSFDTSMAQKAFGQFNTFFPVSKERVRSLKKENFGDQVVEKLKFKSELKGKVSTEKRLSTLANHLTTSGILSDAIESNFPMSSQKDVLEVSEYLEHFFNYLIGSFQEEFVHNQNKYRETSYINNQFMFAGYVALAKKLKEETIPLNQIETIIKSINFSKVDSPFAEMYKKRKIVPLVCDYFNKLNISELATL